MNRDVIGIGNIVIDHQLILDRLPDPDTKLLASHARFQVGGPTPTALVQLARFGRTCSFIGSWAVDTFGEMISKDLKQEGLSLHQIQPDVQDPQTGFAHVWVDQSNASRTIAYSRGTSAIEPSDIDRARLTEHQILHLDGWPTEASIHAAKIMRSAGRHVTLDSGNPKPGMEDLIPHVDTLICPERFIPKFTGHADHESGARELLTQGPQQVIATFGDKGALYISNTETIHHPAFPVTPIDTCGAGDVFCGAIIEGLLSEAPPKDMLRFACATAAIKCRSLGNRDALASHESVQDLITIPS